MRQYKPYLVFIFLALAVIGFADATYLTVEHFVNAIPPCFIADGCEIVLTSKWSEIMGVPISLIGSIYYLTITLLTVLYLTTKKSLAFKTAFGISTTGFLVSLFLVGLQIFVIHDICFYCMISAITSTLLFIIGLMTIKASKIEVLEKQNETNSNVDL